MHAMQEGDTASPHEPTPTTNGYADSPTLGARKQTRPQMRDTIAEAILVAVKRLYLLGKNDRPTGTFTFAELLAHEQSVEHGRPAV